MSDRPKVGVAVFIVKDKKILMLKRIGAHGADTWSVPGGHLEYGEEPEDAAAREAMEEVGIKITNIRRSVYTNDIFEKENKHYITLFFIAEIESGEPKILEPDRTEEIGWFEWGNLPQPLFLPEINLLKQGFDLFE
ncbi:MAG: NUDIX domain-containing protein [Candidatus Magasanikbacteria bacterium]